MAVEIRREPAVEERHEFIAKVWAPGHPLKVVSPAVVIRAIEASTRKGPLQPPEDRLVPDVHSQSHLGLAAVAAEVPLSDQKPDEEPDVELRWHGHPRCFTVMLHGKPRWDLATSRPSIGCRRRRRSSSGPRCPPHPRRGTSRSSGAPLCGGGGAGRRRRWPGRDG